MQALRCTSIFEVVKFFSLYDLCVTEEQKIRLLSLAATSGNIFTELYSIYINIVIESQFPIEMNPLKVLVSVIHDTESIIHKAVDAKEAELSREVKGDLMFLLITYIQAYIQTYMDIHRVHWV